MKRSLTCIFALLLAACVFAGQSKRPLDLLHKKASAVLSHAFNYSAELGKLAPNDRTTVRTQNAAQKLLNRYYAEGGHYLAGGNKQKATLKSSAGKNGATMLTNVVKELEAQFPKTGSIAQVTRNQAKKDLDGLKAQVKDYTGALPKDPALSNHLLAALAAAVTLQNHLGG